MTGAAAAPPGLDVDRVTAWLGDRLPEAEPPLRFARVGHGRSNLTFRMEDAGGRRWVLRRPPLGPLLPSAHDMGREHTVLTALHAAGMPVPRPLARCEDPDVTGAPFYVMEHGEGRVIASTEDAEALSEAARAAAGRSLVDVLARLHAVDVVAAGLGELGRHTGYAERQVRRWRRQWEASKTREIPQVDDVAERLACSVPEQHGVAVVHGDYRLDNVMVDDSGEVRAVLDWELCTLGDPLADVGLLMVYWVDAGDLVTPLDDHATALPGFPARAELAARYAEASGRDLSSLPFFQAFGYWKLAVILQGVYARWLQNPANSGRDPGGLEPRIAQLAELADRVATDAGF